MGARPAPGAAGLRCTLAGTHYVGATSSKRPVCFTVTSDERRLREFKFAYRGACEFYDTIYVTGTASVSGSWPTPNGSLRLETETLSIKGKFAGRTASGSVRRTWYQDAHAVDPSAPLGGQLECDTGAVRWTARRVG